MKKLMLSVLFLGSFVAFTQAQGSVYYHYSGEKKSPLLRQGSTHKCSKPQS
jgi:hypothetical protein